MVFKNIIFLHTPRHRAHNHNISRTFFFQCASSIYALQCVLWQTLFHTYTNAVFVVSRGAYPGRGDNVITQGSNLETLALGHPHTWGDPLALSSL